jgi:hypothetical protein
MLWEICGIYFLLLSLFTLAIPGDPDPEPPRYQDSGTQTEAPEEEIPPEDPISLLWFLARS